MQRIELERPLETVADLLQARERGVGRPRVAAPWRERVVAVLAAELALPYSMPPEAIGIPGMLWLYSERVRIVATLRTRARPRA